MKEAGRKSVWRLLLRLLPPMTRIRINSRKTLKFTYLPLKMEVVLPLLSHLGGDRAYSHKRRPCWLQQESDVIGRRIEFLICLTPHGYWWCCMLFPSLTQVHLWRRSPEWSQEKWGSPQHPRKWVGIRQSCDKRAFAGKIGRQVITQF